VPCYNEEKKLSLTEYNLFLSQHKNVFLCFVNDGSADKTIDALTEINRAFPNNTYILNLKKNVGKGNAVREGVLYVLNNISSNNIAYLDADLATPFSEILRLNNILKNNSSANLVFGSRVLTLNNSIQRKKYRHLIGRVVASFISVILKSKIYDTQCGAKVMTKPCAEAVFKQLFLSRWLFDVEIFMRIKKAFGKLDIFTHEEPLKLWEDKGKSSVKWSYGLFVWWDLFKIHLRG